MNKQLRIIDADKLLEWLEVDMRAIEFWRGGEGVEAFDNLTDAINNGEFEPDPIPLPTIKPGDIIADLLFAFINQDTDCPHDFEIQAVEEAVNYLRNNYQSDKYNPQLFENHLKQMLEVSHD